jgi:hypothetical protein
MAFTQEQPVAAEQSAAADNAPALLTADQLDILVARIALYPDDLMALILTASTYPLQIVEGARFLEAVERSPDLKPKDSWDGSVISLLNYPEIVKMMNDDLDWTQALAAAIANQQGDVLAAIQHLRDNAITTGSIKSDDKIEVVEQGDNVVIQSTNPDAVYIPQYEPAALYEPTRQPAPISYYPRAYPSYYHPVAPYFAGVVTGAAFAAVVDWDDWGVWGGDWDGGDVDIDCNNCFNDRDFNGTVKWNDVDWKNVDRSKISVNRDQLNNVDRTEIKNSIKSNDRNSVGNRAADAGRSAVSRTPGKSNNATSVRRRTTEGASESRREGQRSTSNRSGSRERGATERGPRRPTATTDANRPSKVDRAPSSRGDSGSRPRSDRSRTTSRRSEAPERCGNRRCQGGIGHR